MTRSIASRDYLEGNGVATTRRYIAGVATRSETVGDLLRGWRVRRRLSQLDLAGEAEVSARHLSFVECGRAAPSRDLLLRLAEPLSMPLRERNRLLLAGGYAPVHSERALDSPDLDTARATVEAVLRAHQPFPALVVDRHWNLVLANDAARMLLSRANPLLLVPPVNVLRASLHPDGPASSIINLAEWRHHLLGRLRDEGERSADPILVALYDELRALPAPASQRPPDPIARIAVPLTIRDLASGCVFSFLSTTTVFGTATDVTLAELTLECFFPADDATRRAILAREV